LQDQFLSIKGVAGTEIVGGLKREIQIQIDKERLSAYNLTLEQIIKRIKDENIERLAGRVTETNREFSLRTIAEYQTLDDIENTIIKNSNIGVIKVKDLAKVVDTHEEQRVVTRFNGNAAIKLNILKQADANTVEVSDAVNVLISKLENTAPSDIKFNTVENQSDYIKGAISGVRDSAIAAIILVILVIYLFLGQFKQVLVMLIALPVTILFNFFLMQLLGFSINIFSLGGLVVAMGVVLDNSIVVIENITRIHKVKGEADEETAYTGTMDVALAILASTLTFLALFMPFLMIPGLTSLLFRELILTIAGVVVVSLLVALTVTPMLSHYLVVMKGTKTEKKSTFDKLVDSLNSLYQKLLNKLLPLRWAVLAVFVILLAGSYFIIQQIGSEFLPKIDDGRIMVKVILPPGTSVEKTDRLLQDIESVVKEQNAVDKYFTLSGGKVWGLVTYEIASEGQIDIELVEKSKRDISTDNFIEQLRPLVMKKMIPGAKIVVQQAKMKGIRRTGDSDVEIKVRGIELERIQEIAQQVVQQMNAIDGLTNVRIGTQINKPEYQIEVDKVRLAALEMSTDRFAASVKTYVDGSVPTQLREAGEYYDIRVLAPKEKITSKQDIENLQIDISGNNKVPLRTVAKVNERLGPVEIIREDQIKQIVVSSDVVKGADVGTTAQLLQNKLAGINLPEGYSFEFGGQVYLLEESQNVMLRIILFALFFAYVILAIQFNSFKQPFMILLGVPFAFIGASLALYLSDMPIGATVLIGIIIMSGGIATQGVVLISVINDFVKQGLSNREAVLTAAPLRIRPILMTQATTILGLSPLAINWGEGGDMLQPMAIAVIGGLFFSLFVTLLLLPNLYLILEGKKK
jgi:HAE1 family hydrophobic/amphiphilic exporter-1